MKVNPPSKNPTSLEQLIFQLQLALELSQIQEIASVFTDILLFLAKYSFLFEAENTEIPPVTSDPARDGGNWWNYCNSNPVKYIDPDGRKIYISEIDDGKYNKARYALKQLQKTPRGKELIQKLHSSTEIFYITINSDSNNSYDENVISWDPDCVGYTGENEKISSITFLGHELGHAEQDLDGNLQSMKELLNSDMTSNEIATYIFLKENENLEKTENKIAESRGEAIRTDYKQPVILKREELNVE